jgi:hypothetical protein
VNCFAGADSGQATAYRNMRLAAGANVSEEEKEPAPRAMISLEIVAELAYRSATSGQQADEQTLNNVARAIAGCIDIFECEAGAKPHLVTRDEVREGHFRRRGLTLDFNNGRGSRKNLYLRVTDLSRAIVEINHLFRPER